MIREGHLSTYDLTLITRAPLFVGSGAVIKKTGYLLGNTGNRITVLDTDKLLWHLASNGFAEQYESFVLSGQTNMYRFLTQECGLSRSELNGLSLYQVNVANVLDNTHSLKEIRQITRTADNRVYIPGSSLKGALRTALLLGPIAKAAPGPQEHLYREYKFREGKYTNTLRYVNDVKGKAVGEVASVLQGIRISDSAPVSNRYITLASKVDAATNGETNKLNVVWECIAPGTELHFKLTLDHSVLDGCFFNGKRGIDVDIIRSAICDFAAYYRKQYMTKFQKPAGSIDINCPNAIWLGGNAGYFSKTLSYPYWKDRALDEVSSYMASSFPRHKHKFDKEHQISPHTLSYAQCGGKLYPMGLCEVNIT